MKKSTPLLDALLAKPVGSVSAQKPGPRPDVRPTRVLEVTGSTATADLPDNDPDNPVNVGTALAFLEKEGQRPEEWEVISFRRSEWTVGLDQVPQSSVRFSFRRITDTPDSDRLRHAEIDAMATRAMLAPPHTPAPADPQGGAFVFFQTDEQLGKMENWDAVERLFQYVEAAVDRFLDLPVRPAEIVIAYGGDFCENFLSGGGTQVWRTTLTLTEQTRVARRLIQHTVQAFAPLADKITVTTCASNHGQAVRIAGKGETRIDDDHGIENVIAVADACALSPDAFGHVSFVVPDDDSGVTVFEAGGTSFGLAHGHSWKAGGHWAWLANAGVSRFPIGDVDILLAGHHHSLKVEERAARTFIQGPSCESESVWFRNAQNITGNPGIVTFRALNGQVLDFQVVR